MKCPGCVNNVMCQECFKGPPESFKRFIKALSWCFREAGYIFLDVIESQKYTDTGHSLTYLLTLIVPELKSTSR